MPGTLYVVATPIGNLEDVSLRALRVLREVTLIAAEDTRRTARLLAHHGIATRTISFHEHNTRTRVPQLVARLEGGDSIALVTDAGMPGISDPGVELVQEVVARGIAVDPIPGASAPIAAAVASGFPLIPLTVWGFPPIRSKDRNRWFEMVSASKYTFTFFEAPHRIVETLAAAAHILGERPIMVARELTKVHQEFLRGTAIEVAERIRERTKGEFTVVVGPSTNNFATAAVASDTDVVTLFRQMTDSGGASRRQAINATANQLGLSSRQVYAAIERSK